MNAMGNAPSFITQKLSKGIFLKKISFLCHRTKRQCLLFDHPVENDERCLSCDGECCRSFPALEITWTEYERLKTLGSNRLYFSLTGRHKLIIENGCEFLSEGKCSIYNSRPDVCRRFICQDE
jgi:uncharacterized protein